MACALSTSVRTGMPLRRLENDVKSHLPEVTPNYLSLVRKMFVQVTKLRRSEIGCASAADNGLDPTRRDDDETLVHGHSTENWH
jgi:hypothetical protein